MIKIFKKSFFINLILCLLFFSLTLIFENLLYMLIPAVFLCGFIYCFLIRENSLIPYIKASLMNAVIFGLEFVIMFLGYCFWKGYYLPLSLSTFFYGISLVIGALILNFIGSLFGVIPKEIYQRTKKLVNNSNIKYDSKEEKPKGI